MKKVCVYLGFAIILCFRKVEIFQTSVKCPPYFFFFAPLQLLFASMWLRVYKANFYIAFHCKLCYFDDSFLWVSYWIVLTKWVSGKGQPLNKMNSSLWRLPFLFLIFFFFCEIKGWREVLSPLLSKMWPCWSWNFLSLPYASKSAIYIKFSPYHPDAALAMFQRDDFYKKKCWLHPSYCTSCKRKLFHILIGLVIVCLLCLLLEWISEQW